jgi:hypothetical protein
MTGNRNSMKRIVWVSLMLAVAMHRQRLLASSLQEFEGGDEGVGLPPLWYDASGDDL